MTDKAHDKQAAELLPCPFCSSTEIKHHGYGGDVEPDHYMQCQGCTTTGPFGSNKADAIAAWNRRAALSPASSTGQEVDLASHAASRIFAETDGSIMPELDFEEVAAEIIRQVFHAAPTQQVAEPIKDNVIAHMVNRLRDVAIRFHDTQQLRERIAGIIVPVLKAGSAQQVAEAEMRELRQQVENLQAALRSCNATAVERGELGVCDQIDNTGAPYQSQWLADLLKSAAGSNNGESK